MVIWFIGLSGAGKSTIGCIVAQRLRNRHINTVYLDGDLLRDVWGDELGHSVADRQKNVHRLCHLAKMLDDQNIHMVMAAQLIFPEWRRWNREHLSQYFEVFLDVPMEVVESRDPHGIYGEDRAGTRNNVVGIDIPFPRPDDADLVLQPPCVLDIELSAARILALIASSLPRQAR
jgi:adenylylsulfate kinase-like enzyme